MERRGKGRLLGPWAALALAACTSGGGGSTPPAQQSPPPPLAPGTLQLSLAALSIGEGAGAVQVTVTRTGGSDGAVSVGLATSDGSALAGQDYVPLSTTVSFAAGDAAPKLVTIGILDDAAEESAEAFTVTLASPTGGATLGVPAVATITILDDDAPSPPGGALNDTGVTGCADGAALGLACASAVAGTDQFPRQDGDLGRDATARDDGDGRAGFSFLKLDGAGAPLADQAVDYAVAPWPCVRDQVTGLTWEVRTGDGSFRDKAWTYSWYASATLGGVPGSQGLGACGGGVRCDTEGYRDAVNAAGLCGFGDWRLPTRGEILGLTDYGAAAAPLLDATRFPDGPAGSTWSGEPAAPFGVWALDLVSGDLRAQPESARLSVRLVRGGPQE